MFGKKWFVYLGKLRDCMKKVKMAVKNAGLIFFLFSFLFFNSNLGAVMPGSLPPDGLIVVPKDEVYGKARDQFAVMLNAAKSSIDLSMYQLKDQQMIDLLIAAAKRGVAVRIFTEKNPYKHIYNQDKNEHGGLKQLEAVGIVIKGLPKIFAKHKDAQGHHKVLIIDNEYAVIMSCNWDTPTLKNTRDFGFIISKDKNPDEFAEIVNLFNNDWLNKEYVVKNSNLIVGPGGQREKIATFLNKAKHSIKIYQQSYNDEEIAIVLENIVRRGVSVQLLMIPFPFGGAVDSNVPFQDRLIGVGGKVRLLRSRYIHAKVIIVDDELEYIGSCNFYPPSLDFNREIGIIISDQQAIERLNQVFISDWEKAEEKRLILSV
jgi:phosphatidylserine/phosphatidylglycerophosphate/cardiolipin synthase-like enzyme